MTEIRPAMPADFDRLQAIEVAAGQAFRDVGLPDIADDDPPSIETLSRYADDGRAWVAAEDDGVALAYVLVDVVDGNAHVEQVSVHPDASGRGLGRDLLDHVTAWAGAQGLSGVTLTTFREVPWNAPYYGRLGFRVLGDHEIGPELRTVQGHETAAGLDPSTRVAMSRPVG